MSWIYESITRQSPLNGTIRAQRYLGQWEVVADGGFQTTPYVTRMWRTALRRVPRQGIKKILLLGFGAGGCVETMYRRFPHAAVTTIEWDPIMVELANRLKLYRPSRHPRIIIDDARRVLSGMTEVFDLIVCDVFQGTHASPLLSDERFLLDMRSRLASDGYLLVNVFQSVKHISVLNAWFSCHARWRIKLNEVLLYRHMGRGQIGDPLPEGYTHFRSTDAYVLREGSHGSPWHPIGVPGCMGARWMHGPLRFEGYQNNQEPVIELGGPRRMITWQPFSLMPKPVGWHQSWVQPNARLTGFAEIAHPEAYWETWTSHAQRHRRRWLRTQPYEIQDMSHQEFIDAYRFAKMPRWARVLNLGLIRSKVERHGELVRFFGARDRVTGIWMGGFAVVEIPESRQAFHLASFYRPEADRSSVGVGLVDAWFQRSIAKGFRFLDFDLFYAPGDPRSWKGFSRFKGQFGITYIKYPKPFIKFVW